MADRLPSRYLSFVAALALLSPSALSACDDAEAQPRRGARPARRPVVTAPRTDASVPLDARALDSGAVATRPDGCPVSLARLNGAACSRPQTTQCYDGAERCMCAASDGGARRWRCQTVFIGPLPPPELPS